MKKLLLIAVLMGGEALALTQNQAAIALAKTDRPINLTQREIVRSMKTTPSGYLDCELNKVGDLSNPECSYAYQANITDAESEL